jgi:hypothetical protein
MCSVTKVIRLEDFIGPEEILTSSELQARMRRFVSSSDYGRQFVRRNAEGQGIWRSEHLVLPGGGRLFCRVAFRRGNAFADKLLPLLDKYRPGLARVVRAINAEGVILSPRAEILLASPVVAGNSPYPFFGEEALALDDLGAGKLEGKDSALERITRSAMSDETSHALAIRAHARLSAEVAVSNLLFAQFRRQNVLSWNSRALLDKTANLVVFNNFRFSATGFSWLKPLLRLNKSEKPKPTPVVMDVYAKICLNYDVAAFSERIKRAGANKVSKLSILGVIAAFDFEESAWEMAKREGFLSINLRSHFGDSAFEALKQVQAVLANVAGDPTTAVDEDYKRLADTLAQLKTNPYVVDLRSLGFEALTGLLLRTEGYEDVQLNVKVAHNNGEEREVDVCGRRNLGQEIFIVECKAERANKPLDGSDVRKFFTETVPAYLKANSCGQVQICHAEIWTTGQIGQDASNALSEIKFRSVVKAAMLDHQEVKNRIPSALGSCKRLLEAISTH